MLILQEIVAGYGSGIPHNRQAQSLEGEDPIQYEQILTYEEFIAKIENTGMGNSVQLSSIRFPMMGGQQKQK